MITVNYSINICLFTGRCTAFCIVTIHFRFRLLATTLLNMNHKLQVKLLSENATLPKKGSPLAAGFDLSSAHDVVIKSGSRGLVKLDISIACPPGTYARIAPRSGLAMKKGIDVGAGVGKLGVFFAFFCVRFECPFDLHDISFFYTVVDADYRGPVGVVLFNFGDEDFEVKRGDRIAQLILEQVCMVEAVKVEELDDTIRGEGGFGSTGVNKDLPAEKKQRTVSPAEMDSKVDPPAAESK